MDGIPPTSKMCMSESTAIRTSWTSDTVTKKTPETDARFPLVAIPEAARGPDPSHPPMKKILSPARVACAPPAFFR